MHNFQVEAISQASVQHFFQMNDQELARHGAKRMRADAKPGYPCRLSLADAEIGDEVILLPFTHHATASPYQASGPIFICQNAKPAQLQVNEIPTMLQHRFLSLRAYDARAMMIAASTTKGNQLARAIQDLFDNSAIQYIQVHNAGPGCYNCNIVRLD